jgi:DNA-binding NtrC family response regulator
MKTNETATVLVVDDDPAVGKVLRAILTQAGREAVHVQSVAEAAAVLRARSVDVVISDLRMPDTDGFGMLELLKQSWPDVPLIMLTAHGSVPLAVTAMRAGAADFMLKPFEREEVVATVERTLAATATRRGQPPQRHEAQARFSGTSAALAEVDSRIARAAQGTATVLLRGESGTGKELAAKLIHQRSARHDKPFVVVDLGAIPENLMESELFGYEKGAFTGAVQRKPGRVALAEGGTLFLDEVGEIPPAMQVKLLRLLQEREYQPLGGARVARADVRFVAATHRDLEGMVASGAFREDLYYRVSVLPIHIPALRERREDIAELAALFCAAFARANGRAGLRLGAGALAELERHDWPGNVRELQNFMERSVVLSEREEIDAEDVARELGRSLEAGSRLASPPCVGDQAPVSLESSVGAAEKTAIATAIRQARGNRTLAARILGISRRSLYNKLAEHGLEELGGSSSRGA